MVIYIKQHLFESQFMKKLSNTEGELKKSVAYKKKRVIEVGVQLQNLKVCFGFLCRY